MSKHDDATTRKVDPPFFEARFISFIIGRQVLTVTLPAAGELVIGRTAGANIRLDDDSVSRCHARLEVGAVVTIEDLGSSNGTRLRDRVLAAGERATVRPGEDFFVGEVLCLVHGARQEPPRRVGRVEDVWKQIDVHCAILPGVADSLALLRVRARGLPREEFESQILDVVGAGDLAACEKEGEALVLLFGRTATEVEGVASLLRARLGGPGTTAARHGEFGANTPWYRVNG